MNDIKEKLLKDPFVFQKIQERAYFIAESNGFAPGRDADNWFAAEAEILTPILTNGTTSGVAETVVPAVKTVARKAAPKKAAPKTAPVGDTTAETTTPVTRAKRVSKKSI